MGQEISHPTFTEAEFQSFSEHLDDETRLLEQWFRDGTFAPDTGVCGLELEGWLLDRNWQPAPENESFLQALNDPLVVAELSRFNFEIHTQPQPRHGRMFQQIHRQLCAIWGRCERHGAHLGLIPLQIGILPTLKDDVMTVANMSPLQRYHALNQRVLESRRGSPLRIDISGDHDRLNVIHHDVMTEAATTSLQIHVQVDEAHAVRFFNAAQVLAAPMVASCANSPYLFGHELWEETRIPLFEQSVSVPAFCDREGHLVERVTFGTHYLEHSVMELFRENRDAFPVLLPELMPGESPRLAHLRLHNGTIWRWNRPLLDFDGQGRPTLRLEHRVTPAGPSLPDVVGNILLFYGLVHHFAQLEDAPEHRLPFEHTLANFYQAARHGLAATVFWLDGHEHDLRRLLLDELLPAAADSLARLGIAAEDIDTYLHDIVAPRIRSGQTGAAWQKQFIARHGADFRHLTRAYHQHQASQRPVHQWTL
ncbi:glutamate-cysteine ligase family protein [Halomonas sp. BM-2019]|uniref:glutamate-cysteine ligase family protein n=1 Tax=Halomonas sp. BM-2019 TaxID=2811227 RepID=UPI001B3C3C97|nr:MAG: hypothetical protein J5F18_10040 [Halomonas sp. BM-2019]